VVTFDPIVDHGIGELLRAEHHQRVFQLLKSGRLSTLDALTRKEHIFYPRPFRAAASTHLLLKGQKQL
jgi:hypothetical protein